VAAPDLQSVLDAVLEGVIVVDGDQRVASVNSEACRILETSAEQAEGQPFEQLFGPDHALAQLVAQVRDELRAAIRDDVAVERRFEGDLEVDVAVSPLDPGPDGRSGVVVVLRDHTLRNSLHERHAQRDQLARYGQIAAGIAHEVKNPLGGIRGAAELIGSWTREERAGRAAQLIVTEVDRITALVDELMVFARGDRLKLAPVNIHRVLDGVLDLLEMDTLSRECEVERIYDPSIPEITADADRLTQVFLNLCRNALQAMSEQGGGTLSLMTRVALADRLADAEGRQVPTLVIAVSDTGPGIAREALDQIATPFFTTRREGVGLGLALARHWVTRHEGSLHIASQLGIGTTARIALPMKGPDALRRPK